MLTRTGAGLQIDAVHTRAICDEIGERLRGVLRRPVGKELPPRLQSLMEQLAMLDADASPSIVPSHRRYDDSPELERSSSHDDRSADRLRMRGRDQQPVKRGSRPSCISLR